MGWKSPLQEHGQTASHNEKQDGPGTRPKQLRDREVSWEGSHRSKLMSRRIPIPNRDAARVHVLNSRFRIGITRVRQRWRGRRPGMTAVREQESAETIVPGD